MATVTKTADQATDPSLLDKLDQLVPQPLAQFDAFPKLPASYKARSESRGFLTIFVAFLAFLLVLNDLGEFIWGWPDFEFGVENLAGGVQNLGASTLDINVDMVVNMPCQCESSSCHLAFMLFVFHARRLRSCLDHYDSRRIITRSYGFRAAMRGFTSSSGAACERRAATMSSHIALSATLR